MLPCLLLFLYISSAEPSWPGPYYNGGYYLHEFDYQDNERIDYTSKCALPPFPRNGYYTVLQPENRNLRPGDQIKSYTIKKACNDGYSYIGYGDQTCFEDGTTTDDSFICLPSCIPEGNNVMSCGGEPRCIMPPHMQFVNLMKPHDVSLSRNPGSKTVDALPLELGQDESSPVQSGPVDPGLLYSGPIDPSLGSGPVDYPLNTGISMTIGSVEFNEGTESQLPAFKTAPPDGSVEDVTEAPEEMEIPVSKDCGILPAFAGTYVAGGRMARRHEFPWHAGIYTKTTQPYMQICGGTLVSRTVVISAAHCFWSESEKQLPASMYAVALGKLYRPWNNPEDKDAQKSDVAEIKIPPYFQGSTTNLQEDIALVIVAAPVKFTDSVRAACLDFDVEQDKKQLAPGSLGKVAGWGLTSEDGNASQVLKTTQLPVLGIKECFEQSDPTFRTHITGDKICAGYKNGTAVCRGDSGGGLLFQADGRGFIRFFLRGIASSAPNNEHICNTMSWASFTHLLRHEHFIKETVPPSVMELEIPFLKPKNSSSLKTSTNTTNL